MTKGKKVENNENGKYKNYLIFVDRRFSKFAEKELC